MITASRKRALIASGKVRRLRSLTSSPTFSRSSSPDSTPRDLSPNLDFSAQKPTVCQLFIPSPKTETQFEPIGKPDTEIASLRKARIKDNSQVNNDCFSFEQLLLTGKGSFDDILGMDLDREVADIISGPSSANSNLGAAPFVNGGSNMSDNTVTNMDTLESNMTDVTMLTCGGAGDMGNGTNVESSDATVNSSTHQPGNTGSVDDVTSMMMSPDQSLMQTNNSNSQFIQGQSLNIQAESQSSLSKDILRVQDITSVEVPQQIISSSVEESVCVDPSEMGSTNEYQSDVSGSVVESTANMDNFPVSSDTHSYEMPSESNVDSAEMPSAERGSGMLMGSIADSQSASLGQSEAAHDGVPQEYMSMAYSDSSNQECDTMNSEQMSFEETPTMISSDSNAVVESQDVVTSTADSVEGTNVGEGMAFETVEGIQENVSASNAGTEFVNQSESDSTNVAGENQTMQNYDNTLMEQIQDQDVSGDTKEYATTESVVEESAASYQTEGVENVENVVTSADDGGVSHQYVTESSVENVVTSADEGGVPHQYVTESSVENVVTSADEGGVPHQYVTESSVENVGFIESDHVTTAEMNDQFFSDMTNMTEEETEIRAGYVEGSNPVADVAQEQAVVESSEAIHKEAGEPEANVGQISTEVVQQQPTVDGGFEESVIHGEPLVQESMVPEENVVSEGGESEAVTAEQLTVEGSVVSADEMETMHMITQQAVADQTAGVPQVDTDSFEGDAVVDSSQLVQHGVEMSQAASETLVSTDGEAISQTSAVVDSIHFATEQMAVTASPVTIEGVTDGIAYVSQSTAAPASDFTFVTTGQEPNQAEIIAGVEPEKSSILEGQTVTAADESQVERDAVVSLTGSDGSGVSSSLLGSVASSTSIPAESKVTKESILTTTINPQNIRSNTVAKLSQPPQKSSTTSNSMSFQDVFMQAIAQKSAVPISKEPKATQKSSKVETYRQSAVETANALVELGNLPGKTASVVSATAPQNASMLTTQNMAAAVMEPGVADQQQIGAMTQAETSESLAFQMLTAGLAPQFPFTPAKDGETENNVTEATQTPLVDQASGPVAMETGTGESVPTDILQQSMDAITLTPEQLQQLSISSDSAAAVQTEFGAALPEGAIVETSGGQTFQIQTSSGTSEQLTQTILSQMIQQGQLSESGRAVTQQVISRELLDKITAQCALGTSGKTLIVQGPGRTVMQAVSVSQQAMNSTETMILPGTVTASSTLAAAGLLNTSTLLPPITSIVDSEMIIANLLISAVADGGQQEEVQIPEGVLVNVLLQWQNKDAMCWLDVVMCLLCNSFTMQERINEDAEGLLRDTLLTTLMKAYQQAQDIVQKLSVMKLSGSEDGPGVVNGDPTPTDEHDFSAGGDTTTSGTNGKAKKLAAELAKKVMEQLTDAATVLDDIREKMWEAMQPRLRCERGKNDSPVIALPLLVRDNTALKDMFRMEYTFSFLCDKCSYTQLDHHSKILPSFPTVSADFNMAEPSFMRKCFECSAPNQRMRMQYKR